jgi:hypothetical protein
MTHKSLQEEYLDGKHLLLICVESMSEAAKWPSDAPGLGKKAFRVPKKCEEIIWGWQIAQ